ncbi:MAG: hypothetical protein CMK09_09575 [Ponticaulis sp.]|nr:hypothetical protein [Ponticaulis sp.]
MVFVVMITALIVSARRRSDDREEPDDYARVKAEVLRLRERVRTLERIVTDPDNRLSRDIGDL